MSTEYCLLWIDHWTTCLQKSEWASWIQALGAIAAILGAVWVSHRQERRQRMHEKQVAVKKSRTLGASLEGFAELLKDEGFIDINYLVRLRTLLEETMVDARTAATDLLNLRWLTAVHGLRMDGLQMLNLVRSAEQQALMDGRVTADVLAQLNKAGKTYFEGMQKYLEVIRQDHPGVPGYD